MKQGNRYKKNIGLIIELHLIIEKYYPKIFMVEKYYLFQIY